MVLLLGTITFRTTLPCFSLSVNFRKAENVDFFYWGDFPFLVMGFDSTYVVLKLQTIWLVGFSLFMNMCGYMHYTDVGL